MSGPLMLNRRQILQGLIGVGLALQLPAHAASKAGKQAVDRAWDALAREPWAFDVKGVILEVPGVPEPRINADLYEDVSVPAGSVQALIGTIDECEPLHRHLQDLARDELDAVQAELDDEDDPPPAARRRRLRQLAAVLNDEDWAAWLALEGARSLRRFNAIVQAWLDAPINWGDIDDFPRGWSGQDQALRFFDQLPYEVCEALGVVVIEGEHPGSSYWAAELRVPCEEANRVAGELGLPFRFRLS